MENSLKLIGLCIVGILCLASASATTVQQLIDSFDYSFYNGTINITSYSDRMLDLDSSGLNDTLIINLSTDATSGTYRFVVDLIGSNGTVASETTKTISPTDSSALINFSSELFRNNYFNYSIMIYNANDDLVFRSYNHQTQSYLIYDFGINVTTIASINDANNSLDVLILFKANRTMQRNMTVTLQYFNHTISKTQDITFNNGSYFLEMEFDHETIKRTHYNGTFVIDAVIIGSKLFDFNKVSDYVNYEDMARTSYIKSVKYNTSDTDQDNLSEFLDINFTIEVKTACNYSISYDLYDDFDNFVATINHTEYLSVGRQNVTTRINGSEIYNLGIDGPYSVLSARLTNASGTIDSLEDPFVTGQLFFTDFERPPLPDLKIEMAAAFNTSSNATQVTLNISNTGQSPAFGVFLDVFDNVSFEGNASLPFMNISNHSIIVFSVPNTTNTTLFTAIVDFDNLVDESNESNNLVQNTQEVVSLSIPSISIQYTNGTHQIFEFTVLNDGETTVSNIQWQFDTNDNKIINSTTNISLASGEKAYVYVAHNFSSEASYNIKFNTTGISQSDAITASFSSTVTMANLLITLFNNTFQNTTNMIFEIKGLNNLNSNISGLRWSINTGNGSINATNSFNLGANETIFIFAAKNYSRTGDYTAIATISNTTYYDSETLSLDVEDIELRSLTIMDSNQTQRIFEFVIENSLSTNLSSVNWTLDTKNSKIINATSTMILMPSEKIISYVAYNYTASGTYNVNASARNATLQDSYILQVSV